MIFKTEKKGWGLKCTRSLKQGEAVLEYIGERISITEFRKRELRQEKRGSLYCMDLFHEDESEPQNCIGEIF